MNRIIMYCTSKFELRSPRKYLSSKYSNPPSKMKTITNKHTANSDL